MYMEGRIPNAFKEYMSGGAGNKSENKKKGAGTEMDPVTGLPMLKVPEIEDEKDFMWLGNGYGMPLGTASPPSHTGTPGKTPMQNYGPSGMMDMPMIPMQAYNPAQQMMQGRQGSQSMIPMQQGYGQGGLNQIDIKYTAADGTQYNIGVVTPQENRGKALYNVLSGLYGVMMAEGKSGKYSNAGKGYSSNSGKGGYSGGKGGK